MRAGNRQIALIAFGLFVVIGCGGGGGGSIAPGSIEPNASSATPSTEPGTSVEPSASAEASSGGGTAAGVCELVTADELAGFFNVTSVKTTVIAGPPDNCIVESDTGDPLTAWSLSTAQSKAVFDALTTDPSTVAVSGIGDKAAIVQNTGLLVLKGDKLVTISISAGANLSEEQAIEVSKQIAKAAAGRM